MYSFDSKNHIHKLNDKPLMGTSTVLQIIAKPLTWWASGLAVSKLGWSNPKLTSQSERHEKANASLEEIKGLDSVEYLKLLDSAYRAHADNLKTASEGGVDLHAELEKFVKFKMTGEAPDNTMFDAKIMPFIEWTEKNVKRFLWSEMYCYSEKMWVGGITDCGAELNSGEIVIIDFKSSKEAYPSQFFQIAGYDIQIEENGGFTEDGKSIFKLPKPVSQYIIVPFGAKDPYPVVIRDIEGCRDAFKGALTVYKQLNKEQ